MPLTHSQCQAASSGMALWNPGIKTKWEQVKHIPSPYSLGSALSGSCLTWKELFVGLPCAMGTWLDRGRSGAADPDE